MNKHPTKPDIIQALSTLQIKPTQTALKIKGLRATIYMFLQHNRIIDAHRQLLSSRCTQGNRLISKMLPQQYHDNFSSACAEYIIEDQSRRRD